jgi:hypothetical protein
MKGRYSREGIRKRGEDLEGGLFVLVKIGGKKKAREKF